MTDVTSRGDGVADADLEAARGRRALGPLRRGLASGLFPADARRTPWWGYAAITVACGALALGRLGRVGLNTFWGEDGQVFYQGAVVHPLRSLIATWHGYWELTPRLLAAVVALFPVPWASAANAVVDALALGLLAALAYRACAPHIATPWLRLVPAVVTAVCPVGDETWGVIANLMWPMYFVVVLVLLWNPRRPVPIAIGAAATLLLTLTSPFGILLAPIAVVRIAALGRDRGSVIPVAALAGAAVETGISLLGNGRQTYSTILPGTLIRNYLFDVAERGFLGERFIPPHFVVLGGVAVAAVCVAVALIGVAGLGRRFALATLMLVYSVGYHVVVMVLSGTGLGGSTGDRYYVGPLLLLAYAMVVAFDAVLSGGPLSGARRAVPRITAGVLCAALTAGLAFSVATDWNKPNKHRLSPTWPASLSGARAWCAGKPADTAVRLRITSIHPTVPWYVTLSCSDVR